MAWNPDPKVADCRNIAKKWDKQQVIIIGIDDEGEYEMATYGDTKEACACARTLGDKALKAIYQYIATCCAESQAPHEPHNS